MADSIHIIGSKESGGAERFYARLIHSLAETRRVLAINKAGSSVAGLLDPGVEQEVAWSPKAKLLDTAQICQEQICAKPRRGEAQGCAEQKLHASRYAFALQPHRWPER